MSTAQAMALICSIISLTLVFETIYAKDMKRSPSTELLVVTIVLSIIFSFCELL